MLLADRGYDADWIRALAAKKGACATETLKKRHKATNGIYERFHETVLNEFNGVAFRKELYRSLDELQADLDVWIKIWRVGRVIAI